MNNNFLKKITNLHILSESEMGIFTQDEIWHMRPLLNDFGSVSALTKPVKLKLPVGCKDGNDIVTAFDGQMIVFTTARGITALSPKDFVATTEQNLTYLSDGIQNKYRAFYEDGNIKIAIYRYWTIFYHGQEMLALDTRNNSWWIWTTPYVIDRLTVDRRLYVLNAR